ncbi:putative tRNA adenosine deaminase-associated protein [Tamaricihabitans halophyticus]|uniref:Putative tRNA adenosine deaminase-associated protein n=1 Tax=Tamaricihabitans halophyticus TaxID=1262583 RepID=A0A4R2R333_9PSEU|nr:tRNA adenosine deaminase-associated protein [Tamaricihabitans halophyticus]TCP56963.1 putative tRNA adenosine deaminase-associated protein [Tamaricihabitans halophyticus]
MAQEDGLAGFALAVVREDGKWRCAPLESGALSDLDQAITELRKIRSTGATFGMLAVDDEFFVLLRPGPGGVSVLLSDAAAALDYDVAADVLDLLRVDPPDEDDETVWLEGDLEILADLGMPSGELQVIADEVELFPDEQLQMIAQRCGFVDQFREYLDSA